ncbi:YqiA/YcfP family alpha/beta fold hydrolase [Merismopedia glauca]|nr:YqiA/YcfP family alpha/beta fold hydrolase [Merismopedia glauca]
MTFIYLHGFASHPQSAKAKYLRDRFTSIGLNLQIPDLNQDDFSHLTISRQVKQVANLLPSKTDSVTLIGSSLGGLTAAILAQDYLQIDRLILLAPAFNFLSHWLPKLGDEKLDRWQSEKYLPVYHSYEQKHLPLNYNFINDARQYEKLPFSRSLPTLIIHGINDETIPINSSREFANTRPWVELIELDSDHALGNSMGKIWKIIKPFC